MVMPVRMGSGVIGLVRAIPVIVIAPAGSPVRIPAPVGITPVKSPVPIGTESPVPADIHARIVAPVVRVGVIVVGVNVIGVAAGVIIVVVVSCGGSLRAETLDAAGKVAVVIGFGGGVHHAVGVGHRLRGLVHRSSVADVVLAVGIIGLVVIFRTAADAGTDIRAVACGHMFASVAVWRIIRVVFCRLAA